MQLQVDLTLTLQHWDPFNQIGYGAWTIYLQIRLVGFDAREFWG